LLTTPFVEVSFLRIKLLLNQVKGSLDHVLVAEPIDIAYLTDVNIDIYEGSALFMLVDVGTEETIILAPASASFNIGTKIVNYCEQLLSDSRCLVSYPEEALTRVLKHYVRMGSKIGAPLTRVPASIAEALNKHWSVVDISKLLNSLYFKKYDWELQRIDYAKRKAEEIILGSKNPRDFMERLVERIVEIDLKNIRIMKSAEGYMIRVVAREDGFLGAYTSLIPEREDLISLAKDLQRLMKSGMGCFDVFEQIIELVGSRSRVDIHGIGREFVEYPSKWDVLYDETCRIELNTSYYVEVSQQNRFFGATILIR